MASKRLVISGRVQGVCYRAWFSDLARSMNLHGWVRNCSDGSVEALVNGNPQDIDAIIKAAHIGPTLAEVKEVSANDAPYDGPAAFEIRPSA